MLHNKDYANYLKRKSGAFKTPCPLACAFEFMESRAKPTTKAQLSDEAKLIKARIKNNATNKNNKED